MRKVVDIDTLNLNGGMMVHTVESVEILAKDIEENGLENPPIVKGLDVVSGFRRVLACKLLGHRTIEVDQR